MIDAWLSASETTKSPSSTTVAVSPSLAFHADTYDIDASVPTKRASASSSSRCTVNVPQMKRTLPVPAPNRSQPLDARLHHRRLVAEAEVVVRGEDEHLAAPLHLHPRRLRRVEVVEPLVDLSSCSCRAWLEVGGEAGFRVMDRVCRRDSSAVAMAMWLTIGVDCDRRPLSHPLTRSRTRPCPPRPLLIARDRLVEPLEREAVRDHRRRIELPGAQELRHLDPRVVHPPARRRRRP